MHWIFNLTQEYVHSRIKTPNRIYTLLNSCISKRYIIEKDVTNGLGYNRISKKKNKEISERGLKRHLKKMEDKVSSWDLGLDSYLMSYLFHELINYDKDVKIRYEDGLKLVKLEGSSAINYGATKLACECSQQCEAKVNTENVVAGGSFTIPMLFNLQIESCSKGKKVMRNLESGVYKAEIDYLDRGEIEVWRKISSNTFIVTR